MRSNLQYPYDLLIISGILNLFFSTVIFLDYVFFQTYFDET